MESKKMNFVATSYNSITPNLTSFPVVYRKKESSGIYRHEIILDKIKIVYIENSSNQYIVLDVDCKENSVVFYYQFSGNGTFGAGQNESMTLAANEQAYSLNTQKKDQINLSSHSSCCLMQLKCEYIDDYLKEMDNRWFFHFSFHHYMTAPYHKHQLPITPLMRDCLEEIFQSKGKGMFLKLHIESLTLRLLLLQFEQMENHDFSVFCSLKKADVNKIYKARKIITSKLNQWITVNELATLVGTNEYTLKKGFKELFGVPVFEFIQNHKMEEAHKMLYNSEMNVSSISDMIGYKNVTHFSAAFKRKFGFSPSELKLSHLKNKK